MRYLRKAAKIQAMPQPKQAIVTTQLVSGDLKFPTARVNKSNPAAIITNRLKILIIPKKLNTRILIQNIGKISWELKEA